MNKHLLAVSIATIMLSGCATQASKDSSAADTGEYQKLVTSNQELTKQNEELLQKLKASESDEAAVSEASSPAIDQQLPPNALPGHCYARLVIPEQYKDEIQKVMIEPEQTSVEVEPARYETESKEVLVSEAWDELVVVPTTYKTVEEQVLVKEESKKLVKKPAEYETVTEKVVIRPAYTTWKKGHGPVEKLDDATGEILCLVEVPEESKMVSKTVLIKPERTEEEVIPAEYTTVSKQVVDVAAHTETINHPAVYKTVEVEKMVEPPKELAQTVPAKYQDLPQTVKVSDARMEWREILCETNTTPDIVKNLQQALLDHNYNPGPVDGAVGWRTMNAVTAFQKDNGLPTGQLTLQTLSALGVMN
ncbi:peptidoglycan-binding domain-containing protein [Parathalassolituus penaei]|uniref:Peptidoglycan-binding domain-containing protein n=1 Tax=Parathalassolituus penaei TaxID=2997323 RepID=A0A9X3ITC0_9GAMM|nr:peptidoglycan-binding domain-containing protein [Parathalassolituus penaei]MCY0965033.1 peptidoglycan-binding domain-containing protein [Parathalassolituus penaei]